MSITYFTRIVTKSPYTPTINDEILLVNVPGITSIVLPLIAGDEKRSYIIKDHSGLAKQNPIKITALGNKTIDNWPFAMIASGHGCIKVVYDGTNWKTIA